MSNRLSETFVALRSKERELQAQFPSGDCYLISVRNEVFNTVGGQVVGVPVEIAARHLLEGTHRLASNEEIEGHRTAQELAAKLIRARDPGRTVVYARRGPDA